MTGVREERAVSADAFASCKVMLGPDREDEREREGGKAENITAILTQSEENIFFIGKRR